MKISLPRTSLRRDLTAIVNTVSTKSTLPILRCVLIDSQANTETFITGTNLDAYLTYRLSGVKVATPGKVAIPAKLLLDAIVSFEFATVSDTISIEVNGSFCTLESGSITVTLETRPADEFPHAPATYHPIGLELDCETLSYAFRDLLPAVCRDETRFPIYALGFQGQGEALRLAASNGRVVVTRKIATPFTGRKSIPLSAALTLSNVLPSVGQCEFLFDNAFVRVSHDRLIYTSKLVQSDFPFDKIDELLAAETSSTIKLDRGQLLSTLHVLLCQSAEANAAITLTPTPDGAVQALREKSAEFFKARTTISGHMTMSEILINGYYLRTVFQAITDPTITIRFATDGAGCAQGIIISEDGQTTAMLMPMRR